MIDTILTSELPVNEVTFRALFNEYLDLKTMLLPGYPHPVPRYEIFRDLDPNFVVMPDPLPQRIATVAKVFEAEINKLIQAECELAGFDNIHSACDYASTENPLKEVSASFVNWRAAVWLYSKQYLEDVEAGIKPEPTLEEYLASLPTRIPPP